MAKKSSNGSNLAESFRGELEIDRSDLESCLQNQAGLFYDIASAQVQAAAIRDAAKLDMDELHASLDKEIREAAAVNEEKTTETGIANAIKNEQRMQKAQRAHLDAKTEAEEWGAMKEAFHQRSYMLRELVALEIKRMSLELDVSAAERNTKEFQNKRGEAMARKAGEGRRARLGK
jgi:hypothetical protein